MLPYGRQSIDEDDVQAVVEVLRSDWITTGPAVEAFEAEVARCAGAGEAVAVSSGTAALHAAMHAAGIGPGDEVIVPAMTFVATANAVVFQGGTPVFADVRPETLLVDPASVEARIGPRTRAVVTVDYAGQPCDYDELRLLARKRGLVLIADACHSLGAEYRGRRVGSLADLTAFSFHPVKPITTGEGGMVVTDDRRLAARMRAFRNHGISTGPRQRLREGTWRCEMEDLGYNYRLTDFQCALGLRQLRKLPAFLERRRVLARLYAEALRGVTPLRSLPDRTHAYHLCVVRCEGSRGELHSSLARAGIAAAVHYLPVHLHPYYRRRFKTGPGLCPAAEEAYERILTLPLFPSMRDEDVEQVAGVVRRAGEGRRREAAS
jgi:perosamine synthetase